MISLVVQVVKNPPVVWETPVQSVGWEDLGSVLGLGRSLGEGNSNLLQYSCLENPMDRGAWQATVYEVTKSWTRLSNLCVNLCVNASKSWYNEPRKTNNIIKEIPKS